MKDKAKRLGRICFENGGGNVMGDPDKEYIAHLVGVIKWTDLTPEMQESLQFSWNEGYFAAWVAQANALGHSDRKDEDVPSLN